MIARRFGLHRPAVTRGYLNNFLKSTPFFGEEQKREFLVEPARSVRERRRNAERASMRLCFRFHNLGQILLHVLTLLFVRVGFVFVGV